LKTPPPREKGRNDCPTDKKEGKEGIESGLARRRNGILKNEDLKKEDGNSAPEKLSHRLQTGRRKTLDGYKKKKNNDGSLKSSEGDDGRETLKGKRSTSRS